MAGQRSEIVGVVVREKGLAGGHDAVSDWFVVGGAGTRLYD